MEIVEKRFHRYIKAIGKDIAPQYRTTAAFKAELTRRSATIFTTYL